LTDKINFIEPQHYVIRIFQSWLLLVPS